MSLYRPGKWLIGLVSLAIVPVVHAGPTASMWDGDVLSRPSCSNARSDSLSPASPDIEQITAVCNSHLANIGAELLKPPGDSIDSPVPAVAATSLPAVPGALFMGLTGFLCVSLVKDRKLWMAALASLLWAGHIGKEMLVARYSQLVEHPGSNIEQLSLAPAYELKNMNRLRSDIEGTKYIGLLHHLAGIPHAKERPHVRVPAKRGPKSGAKYLAPPFRRGLPQFKIVQFALVRLYTYSLPATKRLAYITKQHACFSPAFTFENLARGPPLSAWEYSLKL